MAETNTTKLKRVTGQLKKALGTLELQEAQLLSRMVTEGWYDPAYPDADEEKDWQLLWTEGRTESIPYSSENLGEMRAKCRQLYYVGNVFMRNIVRNAQNYVVGSKGLTIQCSSLDDPDLEADVNQRWRKFAKRQHMKQRQLEMVERGMCDGEWFLRFFEDKRLDVRFVEPECIKDAKDEHSHGIATDEKDVEKVLRYYFTKLGENTSTTIPAREILHVKYLGTANMKRGIPPMGLLLNRLKQYDGWLNDRIVLNRVRSKIVLIRKWVGATAAQIKAFADAAQTSSRVNASTGKIERSRKIKAGTMLDTHGQVEYEFLAPNVQAGDVRHDGREIKLSISVGGGQPEYMVTADASNSNFASTWISEAPGVKEFERLQGIEADALEFIWHREMIFEIEHEGLADPKGYDPEENDSGYEPSIEPPTLVTRNRLEDTKANQMEFDSGVLSRTTWRQRDGLDDDAEDDNIEAERDADAGFGAVSPEEAE